MTSPGTSRSARRREAPLAWNEIPKSEQDELLAFAEKHPTWLWNEVLALAGMKPGTLASQECARQIRATK